MTGGAGAPSLTKPGDRPDDRRREVAMRYCSRLGISLAVVAATLLSSTAQACSDRATLLLLDASSSMRGTIGPGQTRFDAARQAVAELVDRYPSDGYLALRLYGAASHVLPDECRDTSLVVPFALAVESRAAIKLALAAAQARGVTPIAYALNEAVADFKPHDLDKVIVLVSDGIESCHGDPCATAKDLAAKGFVIHTVGFLVDGRARGELECIAAESGGRYFDVRTPVDLPEKLAEALTPCRAIAFLLPEPAYRP
jgi:Ca-activated chloride channel family protein